MKTIIATLLMVVSISASAGINFLGSVGDLYKGLDAVSGKPCSVEIVDLGKKPSGALTVSLKVNRPGLEINSEVADLGLSFTLRGAQPGLPNQNLYVNLFIDKNGNPESFDISDFNSGVATITCQNLEK